MPAVLLIFLKRIWRYIQRSTMREFSRFPTCMYQKKKKKKEVKLIPMRLFWMSFKKLQPDMTGFSHGNTTWRFDFRTASRLASTWEVLDPTRCFAASVVLYGDKRLYILWQRFFMLPGAFTQEFHRQQRVHCTIWAQAPQWLLSELSLSQRVVVRHSSAPWKCRQVNKRLCRVCSIYYL